MLARSVLAFLFLALCSVVAALPPACLLEVVSSGGHPGDFDHLCGSGSDGVQKEIAQKCGSSTKEALQSYKQSCGEAGFKITLIHANTTSSSSPSQTSSVSGSGSRPSSGSGSKPSSGMGSSPTSTTPPYTESNVGSLQKADSVFIALVFAIVGALAM
ncbi:TPA_exp: putative GPI anchored cell wall protein [Trichophyton benhamiae CBS 112371]|uniref:GPI anchored cell wall protein, putative n=1 Tax=Arthroderma benhamiae (strain ATCC MYA-4681 / CBS 112371) TaxID=663331 RepID=D4B2G9_ARTBC|nr:GPI anchored cell wall protein, putative [Trichophyton benhamiae CBS 112371]EFE30535.1 GPI anchored cell wall protein, putative [Trichophyton benhamiae CBS 112371]DAA73740.1 TPA_exp: putative GPI anchored cell wall protein [Trichophyton benhamiae CBS 112371]